MYPKIAIPTEDNNAMVAKGDVSIYANMLKIKVIPEQNPQNKLHI